MNEIGFSKMRVDIIFNKRLLLKKVHLLPLEKNYNAVYYNIINLKTSEVIS